MFTDAFSYPLSTQASGTRKHLSAELDKMYQTILDLTVCMLFSKTGMSHLVVN